ncbi:MAG: immunoglobulin domain-containing protein [Verrucomicrobiota bacterium]
MSFRGLGVALLALATPAASGQTLAFPNAEGFGRFGSGGRGGEVYVVTNLNNAGAGSLRDAVANRNAGVPRTVVFAVSGTIYLASTLRITQGNLTIAGQTAPGDGICLAYYPIDPSNSSNVIIRFLRSRLGDVSGSENDAFSCRYASNMIVDHCSFSWSVDETATSYDNTNFTMQWCIISESLRDSVHSKGAHGYGAIWGGLGATFHHNLIAHHDSRNPRFNGARTHGTADELVDMRNNLIYNWRGNSTYGGEPTDAGLPARQNMINNTYKNGPATGTGAIRYRLLEPTKNAESTGPTLSLFHIAGNHTTASATVTADNWNGGVQVVPSAEFPLMRANDPFVVPPVITQTAQNSYPLVLAHSGCRLPARDPVDARIVSEVTNGTATYNGSANNYPGIIDSQADVGGWPVLASTPAPPDSDADGMPDAWETARGLNPANPADRNLTNEAGYTNLEIYLNELAATAFPIPQLGTQPVSQSVVSGAGFSLSVTATGPGRLSYQWYRGPAAIEGATAASFSVAASTPTDAGSYTVVVTNDYGSVRSQAATIALESLPPDITGQPASVNAVVGETVSFTVAASGSMPLTCQWYRGTRPIPGATGLTLQVGPLTNADAGPYQVIVTNAYGSDTSATANLTVNTLTETGVFATGFNADTIHAASPGVGPTATNWYIMSSKNATATAVGDDPATAGTVDPRLDLTMGMTSSGMVETAARFSNTPVAVPEIGKSLRLRVTFTTNNVRVLGLGFYQSGGSLPHTGLINSQLVGTSSTLATGGTQGWKGYRFSLDATSPAVTHEGRPAQPGTNNSSQSLIIPGTSSSAPTVHSIGSTVAPGFTWSDGATYNFTYDLARTGADALALTATLRAGNSITGSVLATATAATTSAATLPSALAASFDALSIGYRNRDGNTVSHVRVTQVSVQEIAATSVADPYAAFLATYQLDPATSGAPTEDPEFDGIANALEFVLGGNPKAADSSILPKLSAAAAAGWNYRFLQHINTSSVYSSEVERSTQLLTWAALQHGLDGVTITSTPFNATHEQIEVHLPASSDAARFLRLSVAPKQTP